MSGKGTLRPAYYAVLTADVRYDRTLRPNAKLLYAELTSLCNQYGYCWATNAYFAELYSMTPNAIGRLISQLAKRGYIRCEMMATETGTERRIYAGAFQVRSLEGGLDKKAKGGLNQKVEGGLNLLVDPLEENNLNITPYSPPEGDGAVEVKEKPLRKKRDPKPAPDWKPERFAGFWDYYPRGESKQAAIRAWDRLRPSDELIDEMARALARQMETEAWREGIGIPYASTWLNNQRWTDAPKAQVPPPAAAKPLRGENVRYL